MLWRVRLSSFAVGFAGAAAWGNYMLREDLKHAQAQLLEQVRARTQAAGVTRAWGGRACDAGRGTRCERVRVCTRARVCVCAALTAATRRRGAHAASQARGFEERLAKLEASSKA
jgi:hypothetical protein